MTNTSNSETTPPAATPRVSIAMPVYNGETFLAEAIACHLGQTFGDFELLVCDNASTDGTRDIVEEFLGQDDRVRYRRNDTNLGANPNFNAGYRHTTAPYFRWAAADDTVEPTYLEKTVEVLDARPEVVVAHARSAAIDRFGEPLLPLENGFLDPDGFVEHFVLDSPSSQWLEKDAAHERIRSVVRNTHKLSFVSGLMRREALRHTLLHRPFYGADKVLLFELLLQGKFVELDEPLFNRRSHNMNSTRMEQGSDVMAQYGAGSREFVARILHGYVSAIQSSDLSTAEKLKCVAVVGSKLKTPLRTWQGR